MELVALLSSGKGTWGQVAGLVNRGEWDNIILIGSEFAEKFSLDKQHDFIKIDTNQGIVELKQEIAEKLQGKIQGRVGLLQISQQFYSVTTGQIYRLSPQF